MRRRRNPPRKPLASAPEALGLSPRTQPLSHHQANLRGPRARFTDIMDDNAPQEKSPPADLNKIDLSQLSGFSFGTSWVQDKSTPNERRSREGGDFTRYAPPAPCGCYFDKLQSAQGSRCPSCADSSTCGGGVCRHGFCEAS